MEDLQRLTQRTRAAADLARSRNAEHVTLPTADAYALLAAAAAPWQTSQGTAAARLLSPSDLEAITGLKRSSKQAEWFKREYDIDVVRRDDRTVVMTWVTYEALSAKRYGIAPIAPTEPIVELCFD